MDNPDDDTRRKKIETAVKFLQNPRVRQTPMQQRRAFLEKKGLAEDEIAEALDKSGTAGDEHNPPPPPVASIPQGTHPGQMVVYQQAAQRPWHQLLMAAVLGGGMSYVIATLVKRYVLPLIYHKKSEEEEKLDRMETSISEMKSSITETVSGVQNTLDALQKLLQQQQREIQSLTTELASSQARSAMTSADNSSVTELKSELLSLKGLLLSRKQFPSPVIGSTPGGAGIPAWQRTAPTNTRPAQPSGTSLGSSSRPGDPASASPAERDTPQGEVAKETQDTSQTNGEIAHEVPLKQEWAPPVPESRSDDSATNSTPSTVRNLNDARVEGSLDASVSDASLSSLSDLSGNASFHEASIAFSSSCVKVPSNQTLNCEPESLGGESLRLPAEDEAI